MHVVIYRQNAGTSKYLHSMCKTMINRNHNDACPMPSLSHDVSDLPLDPFNNQYFNVCMIGRGVGRGSSKGSDEPSI